MNESDPMPPTDLDRTEKNPSIESQSTWFSEDESKHWELDSPLSRRAKARRKRLRTNWLVVSVGVALAGVYAFYVFVLPEIELAIFRSRFPKKLTPAELSMKWSSRNLLRSCEFFFYAWFFYFGASIASFLNVVAWRMPQSRTIVFGGSKCPYCNHRLNFLDNTPVFGWLYVKGHCRTCHLPIAPRYLIIELVIGTVFVWLAYWELIRGGLNLPGWDSGGRTGLASMVFDPQWQLILSWLSHAGLFAVLIMLAVVNEVRKPFPVFPLLVIMGLLACGKIIVPKLDLVTWRDPFLKSFEFGLDARVHALFGIVLGALVGCLAGWLTGRWIAGRFEPCIRRHWMMQSVLLGAVLGWQAVLTILLVSGIAIRLSQSLGWMSSEHSADRKSIPALGISGGLIMIALIHHSLWRPIAHLMGIV